MKKDVSLSINTQPDAQSFEPPAVAHSGFQKLIRASLVIALAVLPGLAITPEELPEMQAENLGFPNWAGQDYAPQISPDGRFLIFQSDRPGPYEDQNLYFSYNRNHADRLGAADWTIPRPLFFPMDGNASTTMQVVRPAGTLKDPPGVYSVNSDSFEGMPGLVYRKNKAVEIFFTGVSHKASARNGYAGLNIYFARYREGRWSEVRHLNIINSNFNDRMPCPSHDGKKLYFISNRPGGYGKSDLWYSERNLKTGMWSVPVNAGPAFNTAANEIAPGLSPDARILLFSSDRRGGFGHFDFYYARWTGFDWQAARNLGAPFNSSRDDEYISFTHDGLYAYFSSDRRTTEAKGNFDMYRIPVPEWLRTAARVLLHGQILDGTTRLPLGVEATIKIYYEKRTLLTTSKVFRKTPGTTEINNFEVELDGGRKYRVVVMAPGFHPRVIHLDYTGNLPSQSVDRRTIILQPIVQQAEEDTSKYRLISGRVVNDTTGYPLPSAQVLLKTIYSKESLPLSLDMDARFSLRVPRGKAFRLAASASGFEPRSLGFVESPTLQEIIIRLKRTAGSDPCADLSPECIESTRIYFDTNRSILKASAQSSLDLIVRTMRKHPGLIIEIQGHTDSIHTREYNQRLSESRARTVYQALLKLGIKENRLQTIGYSFLKPHVKQESSPTDRQLNRRVEFRRKK